MRELVFCLEEESARVLLEHVVPLIIPEESRVRRRFIVFEGKQDLDRRLSRKLSAYLNPHAIFVILRDQDMGDCRQIKSHLIALCTKSGKPEAIVRIACHELEAFYLGDLRAVELGLVVNGLAAKQNRARFRVPDQLPSPSRELRKLTGNRYQKIAGSRAIAPHLDLVQPRSKSFHHLLQSVRIAGQKLRET
jgi:hypothetical protein